MSVRVGSAAIFVASGVITYDWVLTFGKEECHRRYAAMTYLVVLGIVVSQLILGLRTIAIWARKKLIIAILVTTFLVGPTYPIRSLSICLYLSKGTSVPLIVVVNRLVLPSLEFIEGLPGCRVKSISNMVSLPYIAVLVSETVISLMNVLYPFFAEPAAKNNLAMFQHTAHSVICNHVVFLIMAQRRQMSSPNQEITQSLLLTTFMFTDMYTTNGNS
ncbi:hypothetical protein CVT24_009824 [Panaeolus cyanescens]|uniref:Uncharacterized protein n=1 Tax=Panaeolus cyanescens TaxID=181874 RepID=A0A409WFB8_9AGAR|nr:hypothetical protein CVT24_009824 [Panaeolus cyanescens]